MVELGVSGVFEVKWQWFRVKLIVRVSVNLCQCASVGEVSIKKLLSNAMLILSRYFYFYSCSINPMIISLFNMRF